MDQSEVKFDIAKSITLKLKEAGQTAYFAGGCVRDFLMKRLPTD